MSVGWPRDHSFVDADAVTDKWAAWAPFNMNGALWNTGKLVDADGDNAPIVHGTNGSFPNAATGFVWQGNRLENVTVEAVFSLRTTLGIASSIQGTLAGVYARVQGGTLSGGGTDDQFLDGPSAYSLAFTGDASAGTFQFALERWNAGAFTSLASFPVSYLLIPDSVFDGTKPFTLRLNVVTNGSGNVELTAQLKNFSGSGGVQVPGPVILFAITDSSGSKLTGAGFSGFAMGQDENKTLLPAVPGFNLPYSCAQKIHRWSLFEDGSADAVVFDDFVRAAPNGTQVQTDTDDLGNVGIVPMSRYDWDLYASPGYATAQLEVGAPASDQALMSSPAPSERRYLFKSQRPPTNGAVQFPTLDFEFTDVSTQGVGVIARCSGDLGQSLATWSTTRGYLAIADLDDNVVRVWRLPGNPSPAADLETLLGTYTVTLSTGTPYSIGLYVRPLNAAIPDGQVLLELYWGGSKVTLVSADALGVTTDSGGGLVDFGSSRILDVGTEGWVHRSEAVTAENAVVSFTEGTIAGVEPGPEDQASVSFADEGTSAATLDFWDVLVAAPVSTDLGWISERTEFESGHVLAKAMRTSARRIWRRLETVPLSGTQKDALEAFWQARTGAEEAFTWTNPEDEIAYKVHFLPDSFEVKQLFVDTFVVSFGLEELR